MLRLFETFQQILTSAMIPFFFLKNPLPHADEAREPSGLFSYRPYIFRGESVRLSVWLFVQIQPMRDAKKHFSNWTDVGTDSPFDSDKWDD